MESTLAASGSPSSMTGRMLSVRMGSLLASSALRLSLRFSCCCSQIRTTIFTASSRRLSHIFRRDPQMTPAHRRRPPSLPGQGTQDIRCGGSGYGLRPLKTVQVQNGRKGRDHSLPHEGPHGPPDAERALAHSEQESSPDWWNPALERPSASTTLLPCV